MTSLPPRPNFTTTTRSVALSALGPWTRYSRLTVRLTPDDAASKQGVLDIKDREAVRVHLFLGVERHHVLPGADQRANLRQNPAGHHSMIKIEIERKGWWWSPRRPEGPQRWMHSKTVPSSSKRQGSRFPSVSFHHVLTTYRPGIPARFIHCARRPPVRTCSAKSRT